VVFVLRRRKQVTCAKCGASHPVIYEGQTCLICGSTIDAAHGHQKEVGSVASENPKTEEAEVQQYKAEIAALQAERAELSAAITELRRQHVVSTSDFERYVEVAAKGMAERDSYPMPESVTTPEAFYKVMAAAALHAIGPRTLPGISSANRVEPAITQEPRRRTDTNSKRARHGRHIGRSNRKRPR
jgi:hypothetical protein